MHRFDSLHDPLELALSPASVLGVRVHDDLLDEQAKLYIVPKFLRSSMPKLSATGKPTCPSVREEKKGVSRSFSSSGQRESRRLRVKRVPKRIRPAVCKEHEEWNFSKIFRTGFLPRCIVR